MILADIQRKLQTELAKAIGLWQKVTITCIPRCVDFKRGTKRFLWNVSECGGFSIGDKCVLNMKITPWFGETGEGVRVNQHTYRIAGFVKVIGHAIDDSTIEHTDTFCALAEELENPFFLFSIYGTEENGVVLFWLGDLHKVG